MVHCIVRLDMQGLDVVFMCYF